MIALFCGSRRWETRDERDWAREVTRRELRTLPPDATVMHGAAPGADSIADWEAILMGMATDPRPADWDGLGPAAGPERNGRMLGVLRRARKAGRPVAAFAVHDDPSLGSGTADMVRRLSRAGFTTKLLLSRPAPPDVETASLVIHDGRGRFLLQHRDDFAPTFPGMHGLFGGALEPGEIPGDALLRELDEELRLRPSDPVPIGSHLFQLPDRRMLMHAWTYRIGESVDGLRRSQREGQGLGWFTLPEIESGDVPDQDRHVLRTAAALQAPIV